MLVIRTARAALRVRSSSCSERDCTTGGDGGSGA